MLFGGADPAVWSLVPSDIVVRGNTISKPLSWRGGRWSVKSVLELKNARRVLIEGNVIENVWLAGRNGFAVVLTPRNQEGRAPWSVVEDVTIRNNVIRHAAGAFNLSSWDDEKPSAQMRRVQIANNIVYDIDKSWGGSGVFVQIGNSPASIVVEHNTILNSGTVLSVYGTRNGAPWTVNGFVFRDNLSRHNSYGVIGYNHAVGQGTLNAFFTSLSFDHNVLAGGSPSLYPAGNYFPSTTEFDAAFVDAAREDFSLSPGSAFVSIASDGGPFGADVLRVTAATRGGVVAAPPPISSGGPKLTDDSAEPRKPL